MTFRAPDRKTRPPSSQATRFDALHLRAEHAWQDALTLGRRVEALRETRTAVSAQELLTTSPFARLQARMATMPVIEQAKGVLMAQQHCTADEAFDLLRRASQRSNTPIRLLAEQIVDSVQHHKKQQAVASSPAAQQPGGTGI